MNRRLYFVAIMCVFLWLGFVGAISFMESWLKFQAPGVTLPVGLGIGKIVFGALNKMELVFASVLLLYFVLNDDRRGKFWYAGILVILLTQTFWLLPVLDSRANMVLSGEQPAASAWHWLFVAAELVKSILLMIFGYTIYSAAVTARRRYS